MILFLLFATPAFSQNLPPLTCEEVVFRFTVAGKKIEETTRACFDAGHSYLVSENCKDQNCDAQRVNLCAFDLGTERWASGGASLCKQAGGFYQQGAYLSQKKWWDADRCLFPSDHSFVDAGILSARRAECPPRIPGKPSS